MAIEVTEAVEGTVGNKTVNVDKMVTEDRKEVVDKTAVVVKKKV